MLSLLADLLGRSADRAEKEGFGRAEEARRIPLVGLGVLLHHIAHADKILKPEETEAMAALLSREGGISREDAGLVLSSAREAAAAAPDVDAFVRELQARPYEERLRIVEMLYVVAYSDRLLLPIEEEAIVKAADMLYVTKRHLVQSKGKAREALGFGGDDPV